jgi:hypothetical protein
MYERPQGGKIVDGVIHLKYCPFAILYTRYEGSTFDFLGCATEEVADGIVKRFEEHGDMENPNRMLSGDDRPIRPYSVVKVKLQASKVWTPDNQ